MTKRALTILAKNTGVGVLVSFIVNDQVLRENLSCRCSVGAIRRAIVALGYQCSAKSIKIVATEDELMDASVTSTPHPAPQPVKAPLTEALPFLPLPAEDIDLAFGANDATLLAMPPWGELPEAFKRERDPWCKFWQHAFFKGASLKEIVAVPGIDRTMALRHLASIMRSYAPSHEHKIAAVSYLASLWFEQCPPLRDDTGKH